MNDAPSSSALLNLGQAEWAASQRPHQDIDSPVATCPASQGKIYVLPARYALAEYPASHVSCQPGVEPQSHPMAVRRLREGFLYLWQSPGPLQRFAICPQGMLEPQSLIDDDTILLNGSLTGLALDKDSPAWLMYAEYPLNARSCEALNDPGTRHKRMRLLNLPQVANQLTAPHCPPLEKAEQVIAELMPQTYHWGVVSDHQLNGEAERQKAERLKEQMLANPTGESSKAWTDAMYRVGERDHIASKHSDAPQGRPAPGQWSASAWQPLHTRKWLDSAKKEAADCWAVFACLDDDLGVLRDIDHEQDHLEIAHQQWIGGHQIRLTVGGFIRSLLTEDGAELANRLNYRFAEQDLKLTPEQGEQLLEIKQQLDPLYFKRALLMKAGGLHSRPETRSKLAEVDEEIKQVWAPASSFMKKELRDELEKEVELYRKEKNHNRKNDVLGAKIGKYVDLAAMNTWLDETAPMHYQRVADRHKNLYADRGLFLPRHQSGTWFVDYDDPEQCKWLEQLADACLSSQCIYSQGSEQYAEYVRSQDKGALRQLFFSWSPTLEAALNSETRMGEVLAALSDENMANTHTALSNALGAAGRPVLRHMEKLKGSSQWVSLVNRLAPALLNLSSKSEHPHKSWVGLMIFARVHAQIGFRWVQAKGFRSLEAFGQKADDLRNWAQKTGAAIGKGQAARIVNSPAVQNSGGVTALVVLALNVWNTSRYWSQAAAVEKMDEQRVADSLSATLYAAAALAAVVDNVIRKGYGANSLGKGRTLPTLAFLGAIIGALSASAAFSELKSLKIQIEQAHETVDPWLKLRSTVVKGQIATFVAQAALGLTFAAAAISGATTASAAAAGFALWSAPVLWMIAILGGLYLLLWIFQETPLQNFLSHCCWSLKRAPTLTPIDLKIQQRELQQLTNLLYTPRITTTHYHKHEFWGDASGMQFQKYLTSLQIDLPGATPQSTDLELSLMGDVLDSDAWSEVSDRPETLGLTRKMRDIADHWLNSSHCEWIPPKEGHGLRLSGPFQISYFNNQNIYSLPRKLFIRIKYKTSLTSLLGINEFIGGEKGLSFSITPGSEPLSMRSGESPTLDKAKIYILGDQQCSIFLQPKYKK